MIWMLSNGWLTAGQSSITGLNAHLAPDFYTAGYTVDEGGRTALSTITGHNPAEGGLEERAAEPTASGQEHDPVTDEAG
jgi:hypothetical protein